MEFFRGERSWRQFLVILNHLPRASHFRQAVTDDEEWAEEVLKDPKVESVKPTVPLSEYTREVELLTVLIDQVQVLNANLRTFKEKNVPRPTPMPRPMTALERVKARRREKHLNDLVAEVEEAQVRWIEKYGEEA